jgi:hypothetical protein
MEYFLYIANSDNIINNTDMQIQLKTRQIDTQLTNLYNRIGWE